MHPESGLNNAFGNLVLMHLVAFPSRRRVVAVLNGVHIILKPPISNACGPVRSSPGATLLY
jgi:hypothetical protein